MSELMETKPKKKKIFPGDVFVAPLGPEGHLGCGLVFLQVKVFWPNAFLVKFSSKIYNSVSQINLETIEEELSSEFVLLDWHPLVLSEWETIGNIGKEETVSKIPLLRKSFHVFDKDEYLYNVNFDRWDEFQEVGYRSKYNVIYQLRQLHSLPQIDAFSFEKSRMRILKPAQDITVTPMLDAEFWPMIETCWPQTKRWINARAELLSGHFEDEEILAQAQETFINKLRRVLSKLNQEKLLGFDRTLECKLYEIDRAEIQEHTDGSDDGFLYARGFIVSMGREHYEMIHADPSKALMNMEFEEFCYFSRDLYEDKFGSAPDSEISRESASNKAGWSENPNP